MCYPKPGPRCYGHANAQSKKAQQKAEQDKNSLVEAMNALEASEGEEREKLQKIVSQRENAYHISDSKLVAALNEQRATAGGVARLKKVASEHPNSFLYYEAYRDAAARFSRKMEAYDVIHHTVDGKKPSGYASAAGLTFLRNKREKLEAKAESEKNEQGKVSPSTEDALKKVQQAQEHARKTREYIKRNQLSPLDAPPAADLRKSKLFAAEVMTAKAAPSLSKTNQELKELGLRSDGTPRPAAGSQSAAAEKRQQEQFLAAQKAAQQKLLQQDSERMTARAAGWNPWETSRQRMDRVLGKDSTESEQIEGQEKLF